MSGMGELLLIRHGETAWSRTGQLAGRTDLPLTDAGVAAGRALRPLLDRRHVVAAFSSPLSRAVRTAELTGLADVKPDPDLLEWDYGGYEGRTEEQIRAAGRTGICGATASPAARRSSRWPRARTRCSTGSGRCCATATSRSSGTVTCSGCWPRAGSASTPQPGACSATRAPEPSAALAYEHEQPVVSAWNVLP